MANSTWARIRRPHPPSVRAAAPAHRTPINWALWIGLLLIAFVLFLAIRGPSMATQDPMERNIALRVGNRFIDNPVPPFTVPGHPLGTDELGRDVYSRLLLGIRPTLSLVAVAALLRLALGLLIGLGAGWSSRWGGKLLDGLIAAALAIPILIVALLIVVPLTDLWGVRAFLIGLTLTGWGESARQVREQVRLLRGTTFVEASRALGGSARTVIANHLIHHLIPLLAVLLAFEVSSTLLTVAGLGFIGYFVGGEVWSPISDFVAARYAGQPELGQMLNLDLGTIFFGPWRVMASGGIVFLIVLAFNLLGDGLRVQFQRERQRASLLSRVGYRLDEWFTQRFNLSAARALVTVALLLALLLVGGPRLRDWWQARTFDTAIARGGTVEVNGQTLELATGTFPPAVPMRPGNALWSSAYGDLQGTQSIAESGPDALAVEWSVVLSGAPTGGPVVDAFGNIYVAQRDQKLRCFYPDGAERWSLSLDAVPVGSPTLGPDGLIYLMDESNRLTVVSTEGRRLTATTFPGSGTATTSPLVAEDGTVYVAIGNQVMALSDNGLIWGDPEALPRAIAPSFYPLAISAEGNLIFYDTLIVRRSDGSRVSDPVLDTFKPIDIFVGGDGYNYMRAGDMVLRWVWDGERIQPIELTRWGQAELGGLIPQFAGATRMGDIWQISQVRSFDDRLIWNGRTAADTRSPIFPDVRATLQMLGTDGDGTAYLCGDRNYGTSTCFIVEPNSDSFVPYTIPFPFVKGGALIKDHLYVSSALVDSPQGALVALGGAGSAAAGPTGATPAVSSTSVVAVRSTATPETVASEPPSAGSAQWAAAWGDAQGTRSIPTEGPSKLAFLWDITLPYIASGPPTVGGDGTIYVALMGKSLLALSPTGKELWTAALEDAPVSSATIGPDGRLYVADRRGQITVFTTDGERVTSFGYQEEVMPTSGPVVTEDGTVYVMLGTQVAAFRDGEALWGDLADLPDADAPVTTPLLLSGEGELLFYGTMVIRRSDGSRVSDALLDSFQPTQIFVGGDGVNVMRADNRLQRWIWTGTEMQPERLMTFDTVPFDERLPEDVGATRNGTPWLLSANNFAESRLLWVRPTDYIGVIAALPGMRSNIRLIGTDANGTAYLCGQPNDGGSPNCFMVEPGSSQVVPFPGQYNIQGAALTENAILLTYQYYDNTNERFISGLSALGGTN